MRRATWGANLPFLLVLGACAAHSDGSWADSHLSGGAVDPVAMAIDRIVLSEVAPSTGTLLLDRVANTQESLLLADAVEERLRWAGYAVVQPGRAGRRDATAIVRAWGDLIDWVEPASSSAKAVPPADAVPLRYSVSSGDGGYFVQVDIAKVTVTQLLKCDAQGRILSISPRSRRRNM